MVFALNDIISAIICIIWIVGDTAKTRTYMARMYLAQAVFIMVATWGFGFGFALVSLYWAFECYRFSSYFD